MSNGACTHLDLIREVQPSSEGCQHCLEIGDTWVHLRLCMTCGLVACCDSSPNQHAKKHALADGHVIVRTFEPDEDWMWCYADEVYIE